MRKNKPSEALGKTFLGPPNKYKIVKIVKTTEKQRDIIGLMQGYLGVLLLTLMGWLL